MANGHIEKIFSIINLLGNANQRHNETLSLSRETIYHQTRLKVAGFSEDAG